MNTAIRQLILTAGWEPGFFVRHVGSSDSLRAFQRGRLSLARQLIRSIIAKDRACIPLVRDAVNRGLRFNRPAFAIVARDGSGPALGLGLSPAAAWADTHRWGVRDRAGLRVLEITPESADRVRAGNPDAWEAVP